MNDLLDLMADAALEQGSKAREPKRKVKPDTDAAIERAVWKRDNAACTNCGSTYAVQVDHVFPEALGGEFTLDNLRLLCRKCNQRAAIEVFGQSKMDSHLGAGQVSAPTARSARKAERKRRQSSTSS